MNSQWFLQQGHTWAVLLIQQVKNAKSFHGHLNLGFAHQGLRTGATFLTNQGCPASLDFVVIFPHIFFQQKRNKSLFSLQVGKISSGNTILQMEVLKCIVNRRSWITRGNKPAWGRVKGMRTSFLPQVELPIVSNQVSVILLLDFQWPFFNCSLTSFQHLTHACPIVGQWPLQSRPRPTNVKLRKNKVGRSACPIQPYNDASSKQSDSWLFWPLFGISEMGCELLIA